MLNVLIPIVSNVKSYQKLISALNNAENINVLIGITSSLKSQIMNFASDNIFLIEYENGSSRESIINGMQKYLEEGAVMILRKPITIEEFNNFIRAKKDIVLCEKKVNKFKQFINFIWQKMLKLFLGVKLYEGDTSVILFGEDISSVFSSINDLSFSSRVDRWRGLEQGTVEVKGSAVKTEVDKKAIFKYLIISIISLLVGVVVTTCVSLFAPMSIIVGLLLFCLDIICLTILCIMIVLIIFNYTIGKKHFENAVEVIDDDEQQILNYSDEEFDDTDEDDEFNYEGGDDEEN